ncbi:MAG: type I restriction enzyme HsdR N-terminal domain-containing protein [Bacteroidota bacterium]
MKKLNLPYFEFKIKKENNNKIILDEIRKKWVKLTPEEWVRQNFIKYLIFKNIPISLINCEKAFYINKVLKRYDIVVFNNIGDIEILVECKAANVKISNKDFDQLMRYNIELKSKFLILTNGLEHFYFKLNINEMRYVQVKSF